MNNDKVREYLHINKKRTKQSPATTSQTHRGTATGKSIR